VSDERERVADELRRIREAVRDRALLNREPGADRKPAETPPAPTPRPKPEPLPAPGPEPSFAAPDTAAVAALAGAEPGGRWAGLRGRLASILRRLLAPSLEAQAAFNRRQARLDDEIVGYVNARIDATHRHYDAVLGIHGRHMEEIDERHLILQEELVAHVHDLVKRIDLVLAEAERGRLGLDFALRDLRDRVARLEERLGRG
jgi:hypothetical protein